MIPDPRPGARILIVEDEPEFADLLALWVGQHGWRPRVARDGAAAIVSFEAESPTWSSSTSACPASAAGT